jgi:hypothetical protein
MLTLSVEVGSNVGNSDLSLTSLADDREPRVASRTTSFVIRCRAIIKFHFSKVESSVACRQYQQYSF